jgi:hypothetical protein
LVSRKEGAFFDPLSDYQLLRNDCAKSNNDDCDDVDDAYNSNNDTIKE